MGASVQCADNPLLDLSQTHVPLAKLPPAPEQVWSGHDPPGAVILLQRIAVIEMSETTTAVVAHFCGVARAVDRSIGPLDKIRGATAEQNALGQRQITVFDFEELPYSQRCCRRF